MFSQQSDRSTAAVSIDDDGTVSFFNARGRVQSPGVWQISHLGAMIPVHPTTTIMDSISTSIARATRYGHADDMKLLLLSPEKAVTFYLEGGISADQIRQTASVADASADYVDLPEVSVLGHNFTVRIMRQLGRHVAIANADGVLLSR